MDSQKKKTKAKYDLWTLHEHSEEKLGQSYLKFHSYIYKITQWMGKQKHGSSDKANE